MIRYCECGKCGLEVKPGRRFISGHNHKHGMIKIKSPSQLCKCGCGEMTSLGNQFVLGHNRRKYPKPILNHHPCECGCGGLVASNCRFVRGHSTSKVFKREVIHHFCECGCGEETTRNRRFRSGHNPSWNKGKRGLQEAWNKGRKCPQTSLSKMGHDVTEESREKMRISHEGKVQSEEQVKKRVKSWKSTYSEMSKEEKNEWRRSIIIGNQKSPNGPETVLMELLESLYPREYKYTGGNGEIVIAGKCPDFINVNGQKKIIELFGDYWHRGQDPQDRIDVFKPYGYDTLIIWENELKDIERVKFAIREFHEKENGAEHGNWT